jgi:thioredoxin 1
MVVRKVEETMSGLVDISLRPAELDSLIAETAKPVLVEFWAPWCGSCRLMAPSLIKLRAELGAAVEIVALNVADAQDAAVARNVLSLPTIVAFRAGREVKRIKGLVSYANLLAETRSLAAQ